jgi:hypothetical protein
MLYVYVHCLLLAAYCSTIYVLIRTRTYYSYALLEQA